MPDVAVITKSETNSISSRCALMRWKSIILVPLDKIGSFNNNVIQHLKVSRKISYLASFMIGPYTPDILDKHFDTYD